jgi:hypothetical protein
VRPHVSSSGAEALIFWSFSGTAEAVPFPILLLPRVPSKDGGVESHVSQRTRDMGHPQSW